MPRWICPKCGTFIDEPLSAAVREWYEARMAIRAVIEATNGKGLAITPAMMQRRSEADAALLALAKKLWPPSCPDGHVDSRE